MFRKSPVRKEHRYLKKLLAVLVAVSIIGALYIPYQIGYADEEQFFTVNYYDLSNNLIKSESVMYGGAASPPGPESLEIPENMIFIGWGGSELDCVTNNINAMPVLEEIIIEEEEEEETDIEEETETDQDPGEESEEGDPGILGFSMTAGMIDEEPDFLVVDETTLRQAINDAVSGDTITLANDIILTGLNQGIMIPAGKEIFLNGGGFTLSAVKASAVATVWGKLTIDNITITHEPGEISGRGILVYTSGTLVMEGGEVINNPGYNDSSGGGGGVHNYGTFILNGGRISGNIAGGAFGGGVYNRASFTMNGGEISGNTAKSGSSYGGGVYNANGATFILNDGLISGNTSNGSGQSSGGGVYTEGMFFMNGGSVSYNIKSTHAGGIGVGSRGRFAMNGGVISGNATDRNGGGVSCGGEFILNNGEIFGNRSGETSYGSGVAVSGLFIMKGGRIYENTDNYSLGGGLYIDNNGTVNMQGGEIYGHNYFGLSIKGKLNMEGGTISGNKSGGIYSNGTIHMSGGEICGNTSTLGGAGVYIGYNGNYNTTFTMSGGKIYGNKTTANGGGVYISTHGTFTMSGGEITGNTAANGGGVHNGAQYYSYPSIFNMTGGKISGNTAVNGGGVYNYMSSNSNGAYVFSMSGDSMISGNTATGSGGGVYSGSGGTFTLSHGTISGNTAAVNGGGVYHGVSNVLDISGGTITNNAATSGNGGGIWTSYANLKNLFIDADTTFSGNTAVKDFKRLPEDDPVYASNIFTEKWSELPAHNTPVQGYNNYDIAYNRIALIFDKNHKDAEGWTDANPSGKIVNSGDSVGTLPQAPARDGYKFVNWNTSADGSGSTVTTGTKADSNRNITYYAKWQRTAPCTVVFDKNHSDISGFTEANPLSIGSIAVGKTVKTLPAEPERTGYTFAGWNMAADGEGASFTAATAVNDNITVFAKWVPEDYTIVFDANGGEGEQEIRTMLHVGAFVTLPDAFVMEDHHLAGFDKSPPAETAKYNGTGFILDIAAIDDIFEENTTHTGLLYAVWADLPPQTGDTENNDPPAVPGTTPPSNTPSVNTPPVNTPPPANNPPADTTPVNGVSSDHGTAPGPTLPVVFGDGLTPAAVLKALKDEGIPILPVSNGELPLYGSSGLPVWAALNLILGIAGLFLIVLMVFLMKVRRKKEDELDLDRFIPEEEMQHRKFRFTWMVASVILSFAGIVIFLLTENINYLMVLADEWTIVHAVIFITLILCVNFAFKKNTKREKEITEQ